MIKYASSVTNTGRPMDAEDTDGPWHDDGTPGGGCLYSHFGK